jgi:ribonuclease BN (tRNA processing enzyme)
MAAEYNHLQTTSYAEDHHMSGQQRRTSRAKNQPRLASTRSAILVGWAIALGSVAAGTAAPSSTTQPAPASSPTPASTASAASARRGSPAPLELVVLGSGGPAALGRAASSYVVLLEGKPRILVDAGPGSFTRLGEAHLSLDSLDVVLLTHLHVDHSAELPGFVKARAISAGHPIHFDVYGPTGQTAHGDQAAFPSTTRFVSQLFGPDGAFAYLKDFSAPVTFTVTDVPDPAKGDTQPRTLFSRDGLAVRAIRGHHGDAPAVIYRIEYGGHSVAFSGDIDRQGLPALETIARGVNLLVFNSVVLDPPASPEVLYTLHSPPGAIGTVAAQSNVGSLLLSHLSPAVEQHHSEVVASIATHYHGTVQFAADGMRLAP